VRVLVDTLQPPRGGGEDSLGFNIFQNGGYL
jgi:hypothetical protein